MATSHIGLFLVTALAHMGNLQNSRGWQVIGIFKTCVVRSSGYPQDWFGFFDDKTHGEEIARPEWNTAATLLSFQTGTFCSWPPIAHNIVQLQLSFEVEKSAWHILFSVPPTYIVNFGALNPKKEVLWTTTTLWQQIIRFPNRNWTLKIEYNMEWSTDSSKFLIVTQLSANGKIENTWIIVAIMLQTCYFE